MYSPKELTTADRVLQPTGQIGQVNQHGGCDCCGSWLDFDSDGEKWLLMQSTGLKDRNGVEVFAGDILRKNDVMKSREEYAKNPYSYSVVKWDQRQARWTGCFGEEVAGNVHEHPEMLESSGLSSQN
jgi:hypothetical protein